MREVQFVDPRVSRRKFNREVAEFRSLSVSYQKRGWFLVNSKFPDVCVVFATRKTNPVMLMMGVSLNYTNYDARPPSVRLVHPITREPLKSSELPTNLPRLHASSDLSCVPPKIVPQPLMQAQDPEDIPFLCLPGIREYHDHPAHSGDHWDLHRTSGAGRLVRILEVIAKYGSESVESIGVEMNPRIGYAFGIPPT